jgi:hypothetical protein
MAAGFKTTVNKTGTSTPTVGEALSSYKGSNKIFKITNREKQIIDLDQSYVFKEDGIAITDVVSVKNLAGIVEFNTSKTGTITADYNYLIKEEVCSYKNIEISIDFGNQDATVFCSSNPGYMISEQTLKSASGTLGGLVKQNYEIDTETLNDQDLILVVDFTDFFQVSFKLKSSNNQYSSSVEDLVTNNYSFINNGEIQFYLS